MEQKKEAFVSLPTKRISTEKLHAKERLALKREQYLRRKLSFDDIETYFPNGFETLFSVLYFLLLPYLAGLLFLLLFFSNLNINIVLSILHSHSYLLTWCVGYEVLAISLLLYLLKKFIFIKE
jgi:hypothetical protein